MPSPWTLFTRVRAHAARGIVGRFVRLTCGIVHLELCVFPAVARLPHDSVHRPSLYDIVHRYANIFAMTQATVGGSPFGPFISVARGHSRE